MEKLEQELATCETDPWISKCISEQLAQWRNLEDPDKYYSGTYAHPVFKAQSRIGWGNMLFRQVLHKWKAVQIRYIQKQNTKIDIKRWTKELIRQLRQVAWNI